jgi:hypothetical protein
MPRGIKRIPKPPKPCKRCDQMAIQGEKYCEKCRDIVLGEMDEAGYFQPVEKTKRPSEQLGRSSRSSIICGGSAEMLNDGDDE